MQNRRLWQLEEMDSHKYYLKREKNEMKRKFKSIFALTFAVIFAFSGSMNSLAVNVPVALTKSDKKEKPKEYVGNDMVKKVTASSYQEGYEPQKAVDGIEEDSSNCWHTPWSEGAPGFPHWIQVEFTEPQIIDSLVYVARSETQYQFVTSYEIWVSGDNKEENLKKVSEGTWDRKKTAEAEFEDISASLVRFVARDKVDSNYEDTCSVSAAEIKFGVASTLENGDFDKEIETMCAKVDRVVKYASLDVGEGKHQFNAKLLNDLKKQKTDLETLMNSSDESAVKKALKDTQSAIEDLLSSNKIENEQFVEEVSKSVMKASANTENDGYEAEKAVDGDLSSIWHSQWDPQATERPHILTMDIGQSVLLDSIKITPRQDMGTGRITKGRVLVGDALEKMEVAVEFTDENVEEISLGYRQGRYIQIEALEGGDENTAIAEVDVKTFTRGYTMLGNAYSDAESFLGNAQVGEEIGQYPQKEKDRFEKQVKKFAEDMKKPLLNSQCYKLAEEIEDAQKEFASKVNRYTLKDLRELIKEGKKLAENLNGKDKEIMLSAVDRAEKVAENSDSTEIEIHNAAVELKATIDGMKIAGEEKFDLSGNWNFKLV